ncbi:MAG: hypothetical protein K2W78_05670 [Xanthobacteraceae bacterium]|nr:hypothetical protein [Xanthobacteraceae bacterium]
MRLTFLSVNKRTWIAVAIVVLAIAAAFFAKSFWLGDKQNPPGIIFERADRPAKA